jgi:dihydroorotate dehydrogenase (NAD+) catalytic subunit
VKDGLVFGTDAAALKRLVGRVRGVVKRALLVVKLSPNVTDINQLARAAIDGGAECLSMVNTFVGMAIDVEKRQPVLANMTGGLSGPAIRPMAVHLVHRVYRDVAKEAGIPIIGMGGARDWRDAVEFLLAGATAVGIGTASFVDPTTPIGVIEGLEDYLRRHKINSARELIGQLIPRRNEPPAG